MNTGLDSVLSGTRIVPVLTVPAVASAGPPADALAAGGARRAEVTFRTPDAEQVLKTMAAHGGLALGAGTVLTPEQAERAVAAGARFVVSPGFDDEVVAKCLELGVPVVPGFATATELTRAPQVGLGTVKLFPAEPLGGPATLRALAASSPARASYRPAGSRPPAWPPTSPTRRSSPSAAVGWPPPRTWSGATTRRSAD